MVAVAYATDVKPRHAVWSGLATALAVVVMPQLFRLAAAIALFILFRPERTRAQARKAMLSYAVAAVAGYGLAFALADGAAFQGSVDFLERDFGLYVRWLMWLNVAIAGLAALSPVLLPGALTMLFLGLFVVNVVLSLPSVSVQEWTSLTELLPTLPLLVVLGVASIDAVWRRWIRG